MLKMVRANKMKRFIVITAALIAVLAFAACGGNGETPADSPTPSPSPATAATPLPSPSPTPIPDETPADTRPTVDREGFALTLPEQINTIAIIGPSNADILVGLGFADRIIVADRFSFDVEGLPAGIIADFGITDFDAEYIVNMMPDVLFVTGMVRQGGVDDPMAPVTAAGVTVIYMPTSDSIADIVEDIRFIAAVMGADAVGEAVVAQMQAEIDAIAAIAANITTARTVYFEISPAPWMFSFGSGTFLNELIEIAGAVNIFADQIGWLGVSEEYLLELNPDVILTSTDWLDDPIGEIMERPGFDAITAVADGNVHFIDTASSSRPTQNIVRALREIAVAVFPEYFQ